MNCAFQKENATLHKKLSSSGQGKCQRSKKVRLKQRTKRTEGAHSKGNCVEKTRSPKVMAGVEKMKGRLGEGKYYTTSCGLLRDKEYY